jgi:hypothetical protein
MERQQGSNSTNRFIQVEIGCQHVVSTADDQHHLAASSAEQM